MEQDHKSILIVGGGIAGLTLASRIHQSGRTVTIAEKAPVWTIKGAGMHLYSNALRAFSEIGVVEDIAKNSRMQDSYEYADTKNQYQVHGTYPRLTDGDLPALASISRRTLHEILLKKAEANGTAFKMGVTFSSMEQNDDRVDVNFSDGSRDSYDLVIGCDGIYSQVRNEIFGPNDPIYTGQGIWRAILDRHPDSISPKIMYGGSGKMFGIIPINEEQVYMLAGMPDPERPHHPADQFHNLVRQNFDHFGGLAPYYLGQIDTPDKVIYTAIEIVDQEAPWYRGRIFLIGDAAHASPPYLAQGAAMAIEDSIVLGELINRDLQPADLGKQFMERRHGRAQFIQNRSIQRNKERYQGGAYDAPDGQKSERMIHLENNAQREIDELYGILAQPI